MTTDSGGVIWTTRGGTAATTTTTEDREGRAPGAPGARALTGAVEELPGEAREGPPGTVVETAEGPPGTAETLGVKSQFLGARKIGGAKTN